MKILNYPSTSQKYFKLTASNALPAAVILFLTLLPQSAEAYIGPGAGLGAIGTAIALLGAVILLIVGFVWYPVKRLMRRRKSKKDSNIDD